MKKKLILIILLSFFCVTFIFSKNTEKNKKAIEFSIGGGLTNNLVFFGFYKKATDNKSFDGMDEYDIGLNPLELKGQDIVISLPISFVFFPLKYFGIGIINSLGFNIFLSYFRYPGTFEIVNKTKIINKIGNIEKRKYLLIEYGISIIGIMYLFEINNSGSINNIINNDIITYTLFFGPSINIGYEQIISNGFSYSISGLFEADFKFEKDKKYDFNFYEETGIRIVETLCTFIRIGVEVRWRYSFFKKI